MPFTHVMMGRPAPPKTAGHIATAMIVTGEHRHPPPRLTRDGSVREGADHDKRPVVAADPLDPDTRRFAQMGPPAFTPAVVPTAAPADAEVAPRARVSMEELLPQLVKRIAWVGDKRRGSVQMELGAGPHAGTVITVHADRGRVRVELQGDDSGALRQRLEAKGFSVDC